jgi:anti-sigma regulatory factor (Ser/Thr protein kinase)
MDTATDSRTVSLTIPAKAEYVLLARLALAAVCRLTPLGPDDVADLKLAISEAAALAVGEDPDRTLRFDFSLADDRLVLELTGPPEVEAHESLEEHELSRAIVEATVDECDFGDGAIRLVKYLDTPAG